MCGIVGIFDIRKREPIDPTFIKRMNDSIAHRGPDGEGTFFASGIGLGHRRLAIIDVEHGQQPMFNEDQSITVIFNGEIYNFRELVSELASVGHHFRTTCDTEVIVHAWEEWGANCLQRFRGMFAFALYDRNQDILFLARDRLGKKPLYYSVIADRFLVFGSELKAILAHPLTEKRLLTESVDDYFAFGYVPDPATIYQGINKLPPAHYLLLQRGRMPTQPKEYWRLFFNEQRIDERRAREELLKRFDDAVQRRLISDVPLGAFLSGGVDSSGIVASLARQTDAPVETFFADFNEEGGAEIACAESMSQLYATDHHEERMPANPLATYRAQAAIFDEPFADSSSIYTYLICKLARRHVTVALSGDGGDEIFLGYRRYRLFDYAERARRVVPGFIRRPLFGALGHAYPKLDWAPRWLRAKYTLEELALDRAGGYYRTVCRVQDATRSRLFSPTTRRHLEGHHPAEYISSAMREAGARDSLSCAQYADIKTYLAGDILTKVDRASMAVSLEVRVPILDQEFVEWAATLPSDLKLHSGEGKYILKRALEPYVPKENLYRPKQGFATSLAPHFRSADQAFFRDSLMGDRLGDCGLFNMETITRMVEEHRHGTSDHSQCLWSLLMFDGFLREVHNRPTAQNAATSQ